MQSGDLELYIQFRPNDEEGPGGEDTGNEPELRAHCSGFELTGYLNAWESLPPLKPLAEVNPEPPHA
jgi:hypothetical protein